MPRLVGNEPKSELAGDCACKHMQLWKKRLRKGKLSRVDVVQSLPIGGEAEHAKGKGEDCSNGDGHRASTWEPQHPAGKPNEAPEPLETSKHPPLAVLLFPEVALLAVPALPNDASPSACRDLTRTIFLLFPNLANYSVERIVRRPNRRCEVGKVGARGGRLAWEEVERGVEVRRRGVRSRDAEL